MSTRWARPTVIKLHFLLTVVKVILFLPVNYITADITGHSEFFNVAHTILNPFVPQFSEKQSLTVCNSCYSFTDLERKEARDLVFATVLR